MTTRQRSRPVRGTAKLDPATKSSRPAQYLAWTISEYLLRRPILSTDVAFLGWSPQRTAAGRLRRPPLREAPAAFGLSRLATAFINSPGQCAEKRSRPLKGIARLEP